MSALLPSLRGCVNSWDCDQMGHLNVQHYLGRSADAVGFLALAMGVGPGVLRRRRLTLNPVEERVQFKRELRAGDIFVMHSALREVGENDFVSYTEMVNLETGQPAATFDRRTRLWDLDAGAPCPWPDELREGALRLVAPAEALPKPPSAQGRPAPPPDWPGLIETHRGAITIWEVDASDHISPRYHIVRFSAGMAQFGPHLGITHEFRAALGLGLAALDYQITYHRPITPADVVVVRSGVIEVGGKLLRLCHHMVHAVSGEPLTSLEFVLALFDLEKRKIVPVPETVREAALSRRPPAP